MVSNRVALAGLAALCVGAAGAGSYLAVKQNAASPESTLLAAAAASSTPASPIGEPIEASAPSVRREIEAAAPPKAISSRPSPAKAARNADAVAREPQSRESRPAAAPTVSTPAVETPVADAPVEAATVSRQEEPRHLDPPAVPDPPARHAEELVVSADSVLGLKLETAVSSDKARVEDRVEARVARDVQVGGTVVIPSGSRVVGSVTLVERGGRLKERARLGIRFHTLYLADGTQIPFSTETLYRNGEERGNASAAKIGGGAAAGAILGAIIGGAKGAAIGGSVGAGAGTAAVLTSEPSIASFRSGSDITARILSSIPLTVER